MQKEQKNLKKITFAPAISTSYLYIYMYVHTTTVIATVHRHGAISYKSTDSYILIPD